MCLLLVRCVSVIGALLAIHCISTLYLDVFVASKLYSMHYLAVFAITLMCVVPVHHS